MCQSERIAQHGAFALDMCQADRSTLTIGPVTIRLEREALEQLTEFLGLVKRRLVVRDEHGEHWRHIVRAPDLGPDA